MNNERKNMEEYFLRARNQESVISNEEARSIVENFASNRKTVLGKVINYYKGVPVMFKFATIAATAAIVGIMALNILSTDNNPDSKKENYVVSNNTQSNVTENNNTQDIKVETTESPRNTESDVKGVQIVKLEDTDLNKLGIKIDEKNPDNPKLIYWDTKGKKPILCTLYVKGGLSMQDEPKLTELEDDIPEFSPRLITDNAGNRRVFVLDDENTHVIQAKYSSKLLAPPAKDERKEIEEEEEKIMLFNHALDENLTEGDKKNKSIVKVITICDSTSKDRNKKYFKKKMRKNIDVEINVDSIVNSAYKNAMKVYKLNMNKYNMDSVLKESRKMYDSSRKYLNLHRMKLDTLRYKLDTLNLKFKTFRLDSALGCDFKWEGIYMGFDSLNTLCVPNIIVPDVQNLDQLYEFHEFPELQEQYLKELEQDKANVGKKMKKYRIRIEEFNCDSVKLDSSIECLKEIKIKLNDLKMKELDCKMKNIDIDIDKYIKINKLIPIEIPVKGNATKEFSFIFWYDPTPEFLEALPNEVRNRLEPEIKILEDAENICEAAAIAGKDTYFDVWRSCSGSLENLTVFPNPTSGKVNLSFTLLEPRNLSIILHDLSGRKIAELSSLKSFGTGDWNESYKLQDIEPGMYLISVRSDKGEHAVQRVIVE
ncbi:MAG: T9SS type A sorting domain-containing protein [Ignavibacteriae bacterium]|nr:T9SS type A sorting domain-containing protein [Ignavibacteriota bacterium]